MAIASILANLLLPLTTLLSLITLGIGLAACPMESLELQHAFVYLSVATLVLGVASLFRHGWRSEPYVRYLQYEFGIIPLALFWAFLLFVYSSAASIREMSGRGQMTNNGKQIGLATHAYHDVERHLPADVSDPAGPLLSWRVSICPYIEAMPLYKKFDQTKAWDGPANAPFIAEMPYVYNSVFFAVSPGSTPWQGFVGPGAAFESGNAKLTFANDFPDGISNTILVVEAQQQVPWSKPADIPYGPGIPLPPLGQHYPSKGDWPFCCQVKRGATFLMCMADGTVRMAPADIPEASMRALIVRNDGKQVELPD